MEYDLTDLSSSIRLIEDVQPDEVYNLAAQSFVGVSFDQPITTAKITGIGPLNLLEAIRIINPNVRFYQASTSEMFGKVQHIPQTENTPFYPRSPYGIAKLYAHWMTINYYESYGVFGASGILFNHESPLRGLEFVTRKITDGLARIKLGKQDVLELGNLDAKRDWGYAKDFVLGMYKMLQVDNPGVYVLATNKSITVREFVTMSASFADISIEWKGSGKDEVGIDISTGKVIVKINPLFYRAAEVDLLIGDSSKAEKELGWTSKTNVKDLSKMMMEADLNRIKSEILSSATR